MTMSTTLSLDERLNQILPRVTSRDFLDSKGLGNEIGFWIFDYPPDRELDVRSFLSGTVLPALNKQVPPLRAATVDLLHLVTELLAERKLLDKAIEMQQSKGDDSTLAALRSVLKEDKIAQKIAAQFDIQPRFIDPDRRGFRLSHAAYPHPAFGAAPHHGQHALADVFPRSLRRAYAAPVQHPGRRPLLPRLPPGARNDLIARNSRAASPYPRKQHENP